MMLSFSALEGQRRRMARPPCALFQPVLLPLPPVHHLQTPCTFIQSLHAQLLRSTATLFFPSAIVSDGVSSLSPGASLADQSFPQTHPYLRRWESLRLPSDKRLSVTKFPSANLCGGWTVSA